MADPGLTPQAAAPARPGRTLIPLAAGLLAANLAAWWWAIAAFHATPMLLGTAVLAYGLGLRHAVDADHIAAIDNVTRKLRQDGERPSTVGLYFALGHSSVVLLATIGIVGAAATFRPEFARLHAVGGTIGTLVSGFFLLVIAAVNAAILCGTWRALRRVRAGGQAAPQDALAASGPLARLLRPGFRLIRRSWHMYPLGFLFGLGFDTASEIGLLGLSAAEAAKGLPIWSVLALPALFTAGMSLVDTADGVLMLHAYDWAFARPVRKLYYNVVITSMSVLVAALIGGVELLQLIGDRFGLDGPVWQAVAAVNAHLGLFGYLVIGLFAVLWLGSILLTRAKPGDGAMAG
jgi:high-affinity nickel-transport protein